MRPLLVFCSILNIKDTASSSLNNAAFDINNLIMDLFQKQLIYRALTTPIPPSTATATFTAFVTFAAFATFTT